MANETPGLGPIWLICLALVLGVTIVTFIPISISNGEAIKASDWIGFAGNALSGGMTIVAAAIAWRAVQKQIDVQMQIAKSQIAIHQVQILQDQISALDDDVRLARRVKFAAYSIHHAFQVYLVDPNVTDADIQRADTKIVETTSALENAVEDFAAAAHKRAALPGRVARSKIAGAVAELNIAVVAHRQNLLAIQRQLVPEGKHAARPNPLLSVESFVKAVADGCDAYAETIQREMLRMNTRLQTSSITAGL